MTEKERTRRKQEINRPDKVNAGEAERLCTRDTECRPVDMKVRKVVIERGRRAAQAGQKTDRLMARLADKDTMQLLEATRPFAELMSQYECAIMEIETKLKVLDAEFSLAYSRNPFESIKTRLKNPMSILEKLKRKGYEVNLENIEEHLFDIAGIRVICSFVEDIYTLESLLVRQDDIILVERKDYIARPKDNGYRSLHLILDIPIFLSKCKKHMKVEVQFRTIAMDFWASLEHKLKYKKDIEDAENIAAELKSCADAISAIDIQMEQIMKKIEGIRYLD